MKELLENRYNWIRPFQLVLADPPWRFLTYSEKGKKRPQHYTRMSLNDLHGLWEPLQRVMAPDAVLLLWVTDPLLAAGIQVGESWLMDREVAAARARAGKEPKPAYRTVALTWTKEKPSGAEHLGNGYYTRANPEQCLLFRRGKGVTVRDRGVRQWLHAPVGPHSEKPEESYRRIERLFGDVPRLELFARRERPGWTCLGNEIDGRDMREALRLVGDRG